MPDKNIDNMKYSGLTLHWAVLAILAATLVFYVVICHYLGNKVQLGYPESQRVWLRTAFYVIAITTFPLVNLIRHIMLRLNQTMPGETPAANRYFFSVLVSMALVELIGIFGLIMYILGDGFNTLYIFIILSALGLFLYRPKSTELCAIQQALAEKED